MIMQQDIKHNKPKDIAPKLVFFSLRCVFNLINKKNIDVDPKDHPNESYTKTVDLYD